MTEPVYDDDEEIMRGECRCVGVGVVLLCCEGEQLVLAVLIHQLDVGRRQAGVGVQRVLVHRPCCPWLLYDL